MAEIKVGDLVMVVRPRACDGSVKGIGLCSKVLRVYNTPANCPACGGTHSLGPIAEVAHNYWLFAISRLIKIDPPAESLSIDERIERMIETT